MDSFKNKFIEEVTTLIEGLEKSPLFLKVNPEDTGIIQQVFRVMHTLKWNSSMFGLDFFNHCSHNSETNENFVSNTDIMYGCGMAIANM